MVPACREPRTGASQSDDQASVPNHPTIRHGLLVHDMTHCSECYLALLPPPRLVSSLVSSLLTLKYSTKMSLRRGTTEPWNASASCSSRDVMTSTTEVAQRVVTVSHVGIASLRHSEVKERKQLPGHRVVTVSHVGIASLRHSEVKERK